MNLRSEAFGGARYLIAREGIGMVIRTVGILAVTGIIGPTQYGLFAGPFFVVQFCAVLAMVGTDVFLIRRAGTVEDDWYHQVFTLLLLTSALVVLGGLVAAGLYAGAVGDDRVVGPLQVLMLSVPINVLWVPAKAHLERQFAFRQLAVCEVGSDVAQYVVAVGLALTGAGVWAPVCGFLARQSFLLVSAHLLSGYRPRLRWSGARVRELFGYGVNVSGATLAVRARDLVVTVVVGRYLGAAGVGVAALTLRLVETAAFVNRATNRLSIVTLGRMQGDHARMRSAVEEGTVLQVIAVAPILVLACLVSPVLPLLLGGRWQEVARLLPFLAVNSLLAAMMSTQNVALMVRGRQHILFLSNVIGLGLLFAAAFVLVPWLGLPGLGLAHTLAMVTTWARNLELRKALGVRYARALPWALAALPLMFVHLVPWWAALLSVVPVLAVLAARGPRQDLGRHLRTLRNAAGGTA